MSSFVDFIHQVPKACNPIGRKCLARTTNYWTGTNQVINNKTWVRHRFVLPLWSTNGLNINGLRNFFH